MRALVRIMNGAERSVKRCLSHPAAMTTQVQQTIDVTMLQMGVSVDEGTVVEWKVAVGDTIDVDETVCEISTDKVETDVPSPAAGAVVEIVVAVDTTVPVGTVIARIAPADGAPGADPSPPGDNAVATRAPGSALGGHTPVVRRMAQAHSLDLDHIAGTGRGGRVTKRDVLAFLETRDGGSSPAAAPVTTPATGVEPLSR